VTTDPCPPAQELRVLDVTLQPSGAAAPVGYADTLATTVEGPPSLPLWCLWVEPALGQEPDRWERRWLTAVDAAIGSWSELVPIRRVTEPNRAHLRIERRRPPLRRLASGWRASNGRSLLNVVAARRQGEWRLEPQVRVLVSPELRAPVLQAAALHELGHGFGLWGHSPDPGDAMALHQGGTPVLKLSARDRLTLEWLRLQPTRFGLPSPAWGRRAGQPAPAEPRASSPHGEREPPAGEK
jgi:hypothetical protein